MLEFFEIELPTITVAGLRETVAMAAVSQHVGPLFDRASRALADSGADRAGPWVAAYGAAGGDHGSLVVTVGEQIDPASLVPAGLESFELAGADKALCYRKSFDTIGEIQGLWAALLEQIQTRGFAAHGTCREVYHHVPTEVDNFWTVELQQPIRALSASA